MPTTPGRRSATLDSLSGAIEQTAEYLAQRAATVAVLGGNPQEVVALYERAVEADRNHAGALFGLALENDRRGNDDTAMELYKRAADRFPAHIGSLLNLGLLHEDRDQYEKAAQCYQRVLDVYPDHARAALFFKDTEASHEQYYDDDAAKKRDRMSQVLGIPVTDFELSVRSRNCLQKMGIMTLGDLCRCTEQELLASKNFGETSLIEIKEMLATKGLRLGQYAQERPATEVFEPEVLSADEQAHAEPADFRVEPLGPRPEVHDPPGHQYAGRSRPAYRRRPVGVQEFRRDQSERGPRKTHRPGAEAPRRLRRDRPCDGRPEQRAPVRFLGSEACQTRSLCNVRSGSRAG